MKGHTYSKRRPFIFRNFIESDSVRSRCVGHAMALVDPMYSQGAKGRRSKAFDRAMTACVRATGGA